MCRSDTEETTSWRWWRNDDTSWAQGIAEWVGYVSSCLDRFGGRVRHRPQTETTHIQDQPSQWPSPPSPACSESVSGSTSAAVWALEPLPDMPIGMSFAFSVIFAAHISLGMAIISSIVSPRCGFNFDSCSYAEVERQENFYIKLERERAAAAAS